MSLGIQIHTCVNAVQLPELFKPVNVPVQCPKLNGMSILKHATARPTLLVIIVNPVLLQGIGIKAKINAFAQAQKLIGTRQHKSANVQLENTEIIVLNVRPQDFGT